MTGFDACMLCNGASEDQVRDMRRQCSLPNGNATTGSHPTGWVGDGCDLACHDLHNILGSSPSCKMDLTTEACHRDTCTVCLTVSPS